MNQDLYERLDRYTTEHLQDSLSNPEHFTDEARAIAVNILRNRGVNVSADQISGSVELSGSESPKALYKNWVLVTLMVNVIPLIMYAVGMPFFLAAAAYIGLFALSFHLKKDHDKHPDSTLIDSGRTPLMMAAANGELSRAEQIIEGGADPNKADDTGCTALMYAARNNQIEVIKYLVRVGADSTVRTKKGSTALWFAVNNGHTAAASLLKS